MLPEEKRGSRTLETLAGCTVCRNSAIELTDACERTLWTENKTAVKPDGIDKDEIKDKRNETAGSYQPAWLVRATGAWLMCVECSLSAWWPHQRVGGPTRRHYEHFHTHTARLPPKNMYSRFFTSCVTSKPKPSPITTCHELPNFLSIDSLIIFAALWEDKKRQLHSDWHQDCLKLKVEHFTRLQTLLK